MSWFNIIKDDDLDEEEKRNLHQNVGDRYGWEVSDATRDRERKKTSLQEIWTRSGPHGTWLVDTSKLRQLPDVVPNFIVKNLTEAKDVVGEWYNNKILAVEVIEDLEARMADVDPKERLKNLRKPNNKTEETIYNFLKNEYESMLDKNSPKFYDQEKEHAKVLLQVQTIQWNLPHVESDE